MNLILLGPPGSGKGTQAKLICEQFILRHIASGELLRQAMADHDPRIEKIRPLIEAGELPNFRDFSYLVENEIKAAANGFVLDGTPRGIEQCEILDLLFMDLNITIDKVFYLKLSHQESINRLMIRKEGRADDNPETIKHRMEVYDQETVPVIDFYRQKNLLVEIDGSPDVQTIFKDILFHLTVAQTVISCHSERSRGISFPLPQTKRFLHALRLVEMTGALSHSDRNAVEWRNPFSPFPPIKDL